jgi:hypothetical protein
MTFPAPITFDEALAIARQKNLLPTTLGSFELSKLKEALRRRAIISARLDRASVLQVLKENLELLSGGTRDQFDRLRSIPEAKAQLKEALQREGIWSTPVERGGGTIRDLTSDSRRQLIVETNLLDTLGGGRHIAAQNPVSLDVNPAWELVRVVQPKGGPQARRNWRARWMQALRATGKSDGATTGVGRMVALKNHPIWQKLGDGAGGYDDTLGNPWPPFAFNSGMNVIAVPRADAVSLGLLAQDDQLTPDTDSDTMLNALDIEASTARFDSDLQAALARDPRLQLTPDGILKLQEAA